MNEIDLEKALASADKHAKLTPKRRQILELLLRGSAPVSAYEIVDQYKTQFDGTMAPMSVYRILDYLVGEELVHRLDSTNQYLACFHMHCSHGHDLIHFLICDDCHKVQEIHLERTTLQALENNIAVSGFTMRHQQMEIHGCCDNCSEEQINAN